MLWIIPWAMWRPWGYEGLLPPKEIAWEVCTVVALVVAWRRPHPWRPLALGPLGWVLLMAVFSNFRTLGEVEGMKITVNVLLALTLVWTAASFLSRGDLHAVYCAVATTALIQVAFSALQLTWAVAFNRPDPIFHLATNPLDLDPAFVPLLHDRITGLIGPPAHLAAFFALAFPTVFVLPPVWRWLVGSYLVAFIGLLHRPSAILALLVVISYLAWRRLRHPVVTQGLWLLTGGLSFWAILTHDWAERLLIWRQTIQLMKQHPWVGHGLGVFGNTVTLAIPHRSGTEVWVHPHNEVLSWGFSTGGLGLVVLVAALAWGLTRITVFRPVGLARTCPLIGDVSVAGLLAFGIISQTQYPCYAASLAMLGVCYLIGLLVVAADSEALSLRTVQGVLHAH